jgi:hypothetical protein
MPRSCRCSLVLVDRGRDNGGDAVADRSTFLAGTPLNSLAQLASEPHGYLRPPLALLVHCLLSGDFMRTHATNVSQMKSEGNALTIMGVHSRVLGQLSGAAPPIRASARRHRLKQQNDRYEQHPRRERRPPR